MKVTDYCYACLRGLAEKVVKLSGGDSSVLIRCREIIDELWSDETTPTAISNCLLKYIRDSTGVYDPYSALKQREWEEARKAVRAFRGFFPESLEGFLKFSALGNSLDFFIDGEYRVQEFDFHGEVDKIEEEIYNRGKDVLIFGDNVGEFLFDVGLIEYLRNTGKTVYYAVKRHPVQNDLSMADVVRFHLRTVFENIVSTGTDEVGIRRQEIRGRIEELWQGDAIVIAKGMGNYETISEFGGERPVIHIMKVKCPALGKELGRNVGDYIAILGGEGHGSEKRLL
jgi:damage-control phosphatase, subfamily I